MLARAAPDRTLAKGKCRTARATGPRRPVTDSQAYMPTREALPSGYRVRYGRRTADRSRVARGAQSRVAPATGRAGHTSVRPSARVSLSWFAPSADGPRGCYRALVVRVLAPGTVCVARLPPHRALRPAVGLFRLALLSVLLVRCHVSHDTQHVCRVHMLCTSLTRGVGSDRAARRTGRT